MMPISKQSLEMGLQDTTANMYLMSYRQLSCTTTQTAA